MTKIKIFSFLLFIGSAAFGEIPEPIKTYLNVVIPKMGALSQTPYFTEDQKKLIVENFTDKLIEKYSREIQNEKSFSKEELRSYVHKQTWPFFKKKARLPKLMTLDKLLGEITDIVLKGKHVGVETAPWNDSTYLTQIKYQNKAYPFSIDIRDVEPNQASQIAINLNGLPIEKVYDDNCLRVSFTLASKELSIVWLASKDVICPLPLQKKGSFLLEFAEAIAKALKLDGLYLTDDSRIRCLENQKDIDLAMLQIFQQGKSWYENQGFSVKENEMKDYKSWKNELAHYKISDFINTLAAYNPLKDSQRNYIKIFNSTKPQLEKYLRDYQETGGRLFSDFMAWTYKRNCAVYSDIFDLIFPQYNFEIDPRLYIGTLYRDPGRLFYKHL